MGSPGPITPGQLASHRTNSVPHFMTTYASHLESLFHHQRPGWNQSMYLHVSGYQTTRCTRHAPFTSIYRKSRWLISFAMTKFGSWSRHVGFWARRTRAIDLDRCGLRVHISKNEVFWNTAIVIPRAEKPPPPPCVIEDALPPMLASFWIAKYWELRTCVYVIREHLCNNLETNCINPSWSFERMIDCMAWFGMI